MSAEQHRVAVITGAANGIGQACVERFVAGGHRVIAVDRDAAGLAAFAAGPGIVALAGDVTSPADNQRAVDAALAHFGRLDVAVLNAGVGGAPPIEHDGALEALERIWSVNVLGVVHGVRAALPALRAHGGGAIVVTASGAGLRGSSQTWAYSTSKAAVINLVRCLALDHAWEGIRVNAVAPGLTSSRLTEWARREPALRDALTERIPLGRWADAAEQAEVIHFLASPAASYVTGEVITVDGGLGAGNGLLPPARGPAGSPR